MSKLIIKNYNVYKIAYLLQQNINLFLLNIFLTAIFRFYFNIDLLDLLVKP